MSGVSSFLSKIGIVNEDLLNGVQLRMSRCQTCVTDEDLENGRSKTLELDSVQGLCFYIELYLARTDASPWFYERPPCITNNELRWKLSLHTARELIFVTQQSAGEEKDVYFQWAAVPLLGLYDTNRICQHCNPGITPVTVKDVHCAGEFVIVGIEVRMPLTESQEELNPFANGLQIPILPTDAPVSYYQAREKNPHGTRPPPGTTYSTEYSRYPMPPNTRIIFSVLNVRDRRNLYGQPDTIIASPNDFAVFCSIGRSTKGSNKFTQYVYDDYRAGVIKEWKKRANEYFKANFGSDIKLLRSQLDQYPEMRQRILQKLMTLMIEIEANLSIVNQKVLLDFLGMGIGTECPRASVSISPVPTTTPEKPTPAPSPGYFGALKNYWYGTAS